MNQRFIENIFYFYFCFNVHSPINHVYTKYLQSNLIYVPFLIQYYRKLMHIHEYE